MLLSVREMSLVERVILHCDLNSFFAAAELLSRPDLQNRPVAVCGDPKSRHGIILAKNDPAKRFGVKTAETIWQAQKKCPELVLLPAHQDLYYRLSRQVNAIYGRYTDLVEPFGIDESWLDVSGTLHLFGMNGSGLADELRQTIKQELGLTISVGVSFNKIFAKLGSDYKKPDATTVISRSEFPRIVWPLPVTDLLFVGPAAAHILASYGVTTIGQLAHFDREALCTVLGKQGAQLHDYANGLDRSPVSPAVLSEPPKSVGNGFTFAQNLLGEQAIRQGVSLLCDRVAMRLRRHGLKCCTIQVAIRDPDFKDISRQKGLEVPTYLSRELVAVSMELIRTSWNLSFPIRALTITGTHLIPECEASEQLSLFSPHVKTRENLEKLEKTVDGIRGRYGPSSISLFCKEREPRNSKRPPA